jgi:hypothetical protein
MSTLAFDKHGKPFTFAHITRKLLVRFFRNPGGRGTCVAVLDDDGEQLYVDVDADYLELRKAVGNAPGLYRLDQCDEDGNEIDDVPAAYVSISSPRNAAGVSDDVNPLAIVRDLASINAEVSKTMADRFAAVMEKTASILDSAAGAGILDRRLAALAALEDRVSRMKHEEDDEEDDEDEDDEDEDEESETARDPWAPFIPFFKMVEPQLPKLGALLYEKLKDLVSKSATPPVATPNSAPAPAPAPASPAAPGPEAEPAGAAGGPSATTQAQSPGPSTVSAAGGPGATTQAQSPNPVGTAAGPSATTQAPSPNPVGAAAGPSSPMQAQSRPTPEPTTAGPSATTQVQPPNPATSSHASAAGPTSSAPSSAPNGSPTSPTSSAQSSGSSATPTTSTTRTTTAVGESSAPPPATSEPGNAPATGPTPADVPPGEVRNALPMPTPEQWTHLYMIQTRLSPQETALAERVLTRMSAEMLAQWLAELSTLSVDDAVQKIRSVLSGLRSSRASIHRPSRPPDQE